METCMTRRCFAACAAAAALPPLGGCDGAGAPEGTEKGAGMDWLELIEKRRSVRRYAGGEIKREELAQIVADALNAPSWKNSETARYYAAVSPEAKDRLRKEALPPYNAANSAGAAALVAVAFVPGASGFNDGAPVDRLGDMWGAYDCGLASSYFILSAKNRGWDTLIMGIRDEAKVKDVLGIPAGETLMAVIAVGKAAAKPVKPPRKPVAEVLKTV